VSDLSSIPDAGRYEIRVRGHLEPRWAAWFDGMTLIREPDGTTNIHGPVMDQAALHGVLGKLRDIGLPLISVTRVQYDSPAIPAIDPRQPIQPARRPS
jgi:hypothetical protein